MSMLFENVKKKKAVDRIIEKGEETLKGIRDCSTEEQVNRIIDLLEFILDEAKKVMK